MLYALPCVKQTATSKSMSSAFIVFIITFLMDKIIPRSIHYADLKPEAIEHTVKLVRFLPANSNSNW
jgi:hypothetical protein